MATSSLKVELPLADRHLAPEGVEIPLSDLSSDHPIRIYTVKLPEVERKFYYLFDPVNTGHYLGCDENPDVTGLLVRIHMLGTDRKLEALCALARGYLFGEDLLPRTPRMGIALLEGAVKPENTSHLMALAENLTEKGMRAEEKKTGALLLIRLCKAGEVKARTILHRHLTFELGFPPEGLTEDEAYHFALSLETKGTQCALLELGDKLLREYKNPLKQHLGFHLLDQQNTQASQQLLEKFSQAYKKHLQVPSLTRTHIAEAIKITALAGKPDASFFIAKTLLELPEASEPEKRQALKLILRLATEVNRLSEQYLPELLFKKTKARATIDYSYHYFTLLLEKGEAAATHFLAKESLTSKNDSIDYNFSRGMRLLEELADAGYAPAQLTLAIHLLKEDPQRNSARGIELLRSASMEGVPEAHFLLIDLLTRGGASPRDPEVRTIYERAARAGDPDAIAWVEYERAAKRLRQDFR